MNHYKSQTASFPLDLFSALENKIISHQEFCLLIVIDNLVQLRGEGCFAAKRYLGNRLGIKFRQIQRMLSHLQKLKLLIVKNRRYRKRIMYPYWYKPLPSGLLERGESKMTPGGVAHDSHKKNKNTNRRNALASGEPRPLVKITFSSNGILREPQSFAHQCARRYHKILKEKRNFHPPFRNDWTNAFRIIWKHFGYDKKRVTKILDFFERTMTRTSKPFFNHPKFIKKNIGWIEDMVNKDMGDHPDLEITKDAKELSEYVEGRGWPRDSKKDLPVTFQIGMNNLAKFRSKIKESKLSDFNDNKRVRAIAEELKNELNYGSLRADIIIPAYMDRVFGNIANWDKRSGKLVQLAWSLDRKEVQQWGYKQAKDAGAESKHWNEYIRRLYED